MQCAFKSFAPILDFSLRYRGGFRLAFPPDPMSGGPLDAVNYQELPHSLTRFEPPRLFRQPSPS